MAVPEDMLLGACKEAVSHHTQQRLCHAAAVLLWKGVISIYITHYGF